MVETLSVLEMLGVVGSDAVLDVCGVVDAVVVLVSTDSISRD